MFKFNFAAKSIVAAGLFVMSAGQVLAAQGYECTFRKLPANGGWLSEKVIIAHDPQEKIAVVADSVIQGFIGHPIEAKVSTDNDKRLTLAWLVKASSASNQHTTMSYRLTMGKADMKAMLTATPQGYADNFSTQGTCKKVKL